MDAFRQRFFGKVVIGAGDDPCHIWTGTIRDEAAGGYGCITAPDRKQWRCHRLSYVWATGEVLSEDDIIRHRCDNTRCVNPKHLLKGTHADNVADRVSRQRSATGENNGRSKLTASQVRDIFKDARGNTIIGRQYGVDARVIREIKRRLKWRSVTAVL